MNRPETTEFAPYYNTYVSTVEGNEAISVLENQTAQLMSIFSQMPEEKGTFAYAEGKWTLKEALSHLIDGERIFAYRILRISRGDKTPIEGFEQDDYIATSNANSRSFANLLEEFDLQRRSNLILVKNISDEASRLMGTASDNPISVRALVYIMAGHVTHHLRVINERYLS